MIRVVFTTEQIEELAYERFHHPHPRVQRKCEAVFLKAHGLQVRQICQLVGISPNTLRNYLREFAEGGLERLKQFESGGSTCVLDQHTDTICEYLVEHPPHTIAEAAETIFQLTGIRRSQTQIREYLKRIVSVPRTSSFFLAADAPSCGLSSFHWEGVHGWVVAGWG